MGKKYNKGRGGSGKRGGTPKHAAKATVKKGAEARLELRAARRLRQRTHAAQHHDEGWPEVRVKPPGALYAALRPVRVSADPYRCA